MDVFLRKTALFLFSALIVILVFHYAIYRSILLNDDFFVMEDYIDIVVLGDSHTETSVSDKPALGLKNLSFRGESLFLTYYKLKQILKVNPHVKNVVLAYSFHSLSEFQDNQLEKVLKDYYWLLDKEGLSYVDYNVNNIDAILKEANSQLFKWSLSYIKNTPYFLLTGGYRKMEVLNLSKKTSAKRIDGHYFKNSGKEVQNISSLQEEYLEKIVRLCVDSNISLTFLNTPLHTSYYENIPPVFVSKHYEKMEGYAASYPANVHYLDLSWIIKKDEYFHDGDHLNNIGGPVFQSALVKKLIDLNVVKAS